MLASFEALTYMGCMARTGASRRSRIVRKLAASDVISILEALYDWEAAENDWSAAVMQQLEHGLGVGNGSGVQIYEASNDDRFKLLGIDQHNTPEGWVESAAQMTQAPEHEVEYARHHRSELIWSVAAMLPHLPFGETIRATMATAGFVDMLAINGYSPPGIGCCLYVFSDQLLRFTPQRAFELRSIASHVATAHRLRQKLAAASDSPTGGIEAILDARGRVQHATESVAANSGERESLSAAHKAREWARGRARRDEPTRALGVWKGLVSARWTLVDHLETDGKRYVLARENTLQVKGPRALSEREREVVALAAAGRSNKVIAYELGIEHVTVRVLIARASAKLGVRSREELVSLRRSGLLS